MNWNWKFNLHIFLSYCSNYITLHRPLNFKEQYWVLKDFPLLNLYYFWKLKDKSWMSVRAQDRWTNINYGLLSFIILTSNSLWSFIVLFTSICKKYILKLKCVFIQSLFFKRVPDYTYKKTACLFAKVTIWFAKDPRYFFFPRKMSFMGFCSILWILFVL